MVGPTELAKNTNGTNPDTVSVATFSGGGTLGLITAHIIDAFTTRSGKPFHESFDQVHGVSVGALNAAAIWPIDKDCTALFTPDGLKDIYYESMDDVFAKGNWKSLWGMLGSKFDEDEIERLLKEKFGNTKLSDYKDGLNIHVFDLETQEEVAFSSEEAKQDPKKDFYMRDLLRAATAAPTYFKQEPIKNIAGQEKQFTDAGVYASNPSFVTYMRLEDEDVDPRNIAMTNFGTGRELCEEITTDDLNDGVLGSGTETVGTIFQGAANTHDRILEGRLGSRYTVLDVDITGRDIDMTSKMEDIAPYAQQAEKVNKDEIAKALDEVEKLRDPNRKIEPANERETPVYTMPTHLKCAG